MILYCNSDSYGVSANGGKPYGDWLGEMLQADQIINMGLPGSCNSRIFRTTIRDLIDIRSCNPETEILCILCLGSLIRHEYWDNSIPAKKNDGHFQSFQIHSVEYNPQKKYYSFAMEWFRLWDDEAEQTNLMADLCLLTGWLQNHNIQYRIFAGNNVSYKAIDYDGPFIKSFYQCVKQDPWIMDLNTFSFTQICLDGGYEPYDRDLYGVHGHHGEDAHRYFASRIIQSADLRCA